MNHGDDNPLTRFGDTTPGVYAACESGPCKGGTRLCLTPEACQRAAEETTVAPPPPWSLARIARRIFRRP